MFVLSQRLILFLLCIGLFGPAPAFANDDLSKPITVSGEAGLVSDYRFRGVSLSNREPAAQGGLTITSSTGLYGGVWSSTIAETEGGANLEIDAIAGYSTQLTEKLNVDVKLTYYLYPSDDALNYGEGIVTLSWDAGPVVPKVGVAYAPPQNNFRDEFGVKQDNLYLFTGVDYEIEGTPVTLNAQIGYERGYLDVNDDGGKLDWQLGVSANVLGAKVGLSYIDSNVSVLDEQGRNFAGATIVASVGISF
jgi:uncharacterized protein (TIGR02001 family)